MGSLPSPPPPSPLRNSINGYRLYASFCTRKASLNPSSWLECYVPSDKTWVRLGAIPGLVENHILKDFAMVSVGDSIFIIGGRTVKRENVGVHGTDEISEADVEVVPMVQRYDVCKDEWSVCAPLGTPRFDFACTVLDNKIYVAGGKCQLDSARGTSSAEFYDPELDQWTPLPNMSTLRYKCVGVTWLGKILVVGGFTQNGDSSEELKFTLRSSAEVLDTSRAEWDLVEGMWQLDVPPNQIVTIGDRLFSSGDCLNTWKGHIEVYDANQNIWNIVNGSHLQTLINQRCSHERTFLTMAPIGTHLYFLAGYRKPEDTSRIFSVVRSFDTSAPGDDPWRCSEPVEEEGDKELCSHCCVVHQISTSS